MTDHQRTEIVTRSGDTHVIDPSVDHAEAVNIDRAPIADPAKAPRRRAAQAEGVAADPITPNAE
jgi:putative ubiquitin-RnfH superfamily antitoxin RatB of RatAB toxin-antitoxin module